jgi:hypothetical protein
MQKFAQNVVAGLQCRTECKWIKSIVVECNCRIVQVNIRDTQTRPCSDHQGPHSPLQHFLFTYIYEENNKKIARECTTALSPSPYTIRDVTVCHPKQPAGGETRTTQSTQQTTLIILWSLPELIQRKCSIEHRHD